MLFQSLRKETIWIIITTDQYPLPQTLVNWLKRWYLKNSIVFLEKNYLLFEQQRGFRNKLFNSHSTRGTYLEIQEASDTVCR